MRPVPTGYRGKDYAIFVHDKKEEACWTCEICGWCPENRSERVNIVAHHPSKDDLFDVVIICEACRYKQHWEGKWE